MAPFSLATFAVLSVQLSATTNMVISSWGQSCFLILLIRFAITGSSFLAGISTAYLCCFFAGLNFLVANKPISIYGLSCIIRIPINIPTTQQIANTGDFILHIKSTILSIIVIDIIHMILSSLFCKIYYTILSYIKKSKWECFHLCTM